MPDFYSIITSTGLAKLAALPTGATLNLTHMGFGNSTTVPYEDQTALGNEQYRCALTKVTIDPNTPNTLIAEAVIKSEVGGFWIREIGIYDADGDLFAVGKYPATYKPVTTEGSVKELGVRVVLRVSNADTVIVTYNNGIMDGAANTDLDNLTFAGQEKFNKKANIDLDNLTAAGQKKFDDKADLASPTFTGTPKAPTAEAGANDERLANTAFVAAAIAALVNSSPEALDTLQELAAALGNDPNFATTVSNLIGTKANIASPALTGTPTAPTAAAGTNTTQIATTAFVTAAVASLVNSAPAALDTLKELAAALGNDANFATTMNNALAGKAAKTGDTITVANADPTGGFYVRNVKTNTNDPGAGSALANGNILLVVE